MKQLRIFAPAKINLFLNVLRKRKDGYHEIQTLFERVSLCDEIILTPIRSGILLQSDSTEIPNGPKNLAYRAAKLLKDEFKIKKGVRIQIKKRIPVSAGLGGGSSNAAAVLLGLNRLWKLNISKKRLARLASSIGSDCAFFVLGASLALGTGRGEKLRKIKAPVRKIWHVIVKLPFEISTTEAYQALPPGALTGQRVNVKILLRCLENGDFSWWGAVSAPTRGQGDPVPAFLSNSFELIENNNVKKVLKVKESLVRSGALAALMSGSGSSVFGIFRTRKEAEKAAIRLRTKQGWRVFVVSTY